MTGPIIAVDGPAASGKGTLAKKLAAQYRLPALDTGLLYRAVGQKMRDGGHDFDDEAAAIAIAKRFDAAWLDDPRLRERLAGEAASRVAKVTGVRDALRKFQQDFAHQPGGAVLDGRDIGTVIAPEADAKLFVTATPQTRARRRHAEMQKAGSHKSLDSVLADIRARDRRDAGREIAPMQTAPDADLLDTSYLSIDAAVQRAIALVDARIGRRLAS